MSSKTISPTDEQREVIESEEASLVVLASAGAGKTGTLVHRYLRHVKEGLSPDDILTITFTRKAAAEMKSRIVKALVEGGFKEQAQHAETGPIQTIHGFCERLLRENSIAAGMDPEFDVLSEAETTRLIDGCVWDALADAIGNNAYAEALVSKLAGVSGYGSSSPHGKLHSSVRDTLRKLRGSGIDFHQIADIYSNPESVRFHWQWQLLASVPEAIRNALQDAPPGEGLFERLRLAYKFAKQRTPRWVATRVEAKADQEAAEDACGLMHLVCQAWAAVEREMETTQSLDFAALEDRAVRLLAESPACAARIRRRYKLAMIDEAQDVNPMQYRLLDSLRIQTEMLVGDPQQSIYGFRQADVELFRQRAGNAPSKRLTKNWRSIDGILDFVDLLFGRLWSDYVPMRPGPDPMDFDKQKEINCEGVEIWLQREDGAEPAARYLAELHAEGQPLSQIMVLVRSLNYGIKLMKKLDELGVRSRIAGGSEKFYTRLEIRDLANALSSLADPYDDFALLATLRSPFCGISLDTLAHLAKNCPVIEALPSFSPPVAEDKDKLESFLTWFLPMSRYADRMPAWEVISEIFAVSGYLERLALRRNADQLLANVRKLLALASQEPALGPAEYARRIREIQNLKHREGDAPADDDKQEMLTIMTIHKAKGLEWDVVVLPDMHYRIDPKSEEVEVEPSLGMVVPKFGKVPSPFHAWLADLRKHKQTAEEQRVLYVAMTRAKKRLCVVAHPNAKVTSSFARIVASTLGLGQAPPPGVHVRWSQDQAGDDE